MAMNLVLVANTTLLALVTSWTNLEISLGAMYVTQQTPGTCIASFSLNV